MDYLPKFRNSASPSSGNLDGREPLMKILTEYENVNKGLTGLLELYGKEHEEIRAESMNLVGENGKLSEQLKEALQDQQPSDKEQNALKNLKQQLMLAEQEKNAALDLWKLAVGEVSNLEKVLKIFQENKESSCSSPHGVQARLETARALSAAESQLVEVRAQLARERILQAELESKLVREREAKASTEQQLEAASARLQNTEEEITRLLQRQQQDDRDIVALNRDRDDLKCALEKSKACTQHALAQAEEGRQKVAEALTLVDSVTIARDQASTAEAKAKEEALRLQMAIKELTDEAASRVRREVEQLKQQCNARIQTLLLDMRKLQDECAEQRRLAEQGARGQKQAEEALERLRQEMRLLQSRTSPYESRASILQAQKAEVEKKALAAENSLEKLQRELQQEMESHRRSTQSLEEARQVLDKEVDALSRELEATRRKVNDIIQETSSRERQLLIRLETTEKNSLATNTELQKIVAAHQAVSEKCQGEMRMMASRFGERLHELRGEVLRLRRERDEARAMAQAVKAQVYPSSASAAIKESQNKAAVLREGKVRPKSLFLDC